MTQLLLIALALRDVGEGGYEVGDPLAIILDHADTRKTGKYLAALAPVPYLADPVAVMQQCIPQLLIEAFVMAV